METTGTKLGQKLHDLCKEARDAYSNKYREVRDLSVSEEDMERQLKENEQLKYLQGRMEAFDKAWNIVSNELCHLSNDISHILWESRNYD